ncbi:hypothetical protein SAMN04489712_103457 [Thermomonospora echinospora]|uniref:Uncharacterized protein n=1 Tax=Thermomonospora echinospora TaxID=1992 RepID=A0A1H5XXS7_9ACTN|nr:hypothetical protein [Thermomonospora echinospora]SEG16432.1 hypothetical protein SAMN04489712_103457 [Thermomonospora echinospora]
MRVLADRQGDTRELLSRRLEAEFGLLPTETVRRCVTDVLACMNHLGVDPAPALVERMAREHLIGMVKSEPPSGRAAPGGTCERRRDRSGPDDVR